jgi:hypothetical protein
MNPTPGQRVMYMLNENDAAAIRNQRIAANGGTIGNHAEAGQTYPATVVRTFFGGTSANLQVQLDGPDTYWATSRSEGEGDGHWVPLLPSA